MSLHNLRKMLLAAPLVASIASCGDVPEPRAASTRPSAAGVSVHRGVAPVGALPSPVVSGEVAPFQAASTEQGPPKIRDTSGSLPSRIAPGGSAVYTPGPRPEAPSARDRADLGGDAE